MSERDQAKLEQAVDSIRKSGASDIAGIVADLTTPDGADFLFRQVPELDILVNNLDIDESKPLTDITDADWQRYFDLNVMAGFA